ncbi:MAG: MFS transporter [Acidilobus sp.]
MRKAIVLLGVILPFTFSAASVFSLSFIVTQLSRAMRVSVPAVLWAVPIDFIGGAIGGVLLGHLSDHVGRKPVLLASSVIFSLSVLLASFARGLWEVYLAWFFVGFGVNAENGVSYPFVVEYLSTFRGLFGGLLQGLYFVGYIIDSLVFYLVPAWRQFLLTLGALSLLISLSILLVPETARASSTTGIGLRGFDKRTVMVTVGLSAVTVGAFMFSVPLLMIVPSFISEMGLGTRWLAPLAAIGFAGFVIGGWLSDLAGRARTAVAFSTVGLLSSIGLMLIGRGYPGLAALAISFFATGYFSFIGVWASESFPPEVRGVGTNTVFLAGRLIGGFSPAIAATLYPSSLRVGTAAMCAIANALAIAGYLVYVRAAGP